MSDLNEPFAFVVVDENGAPDFVAPTWDMAQDHINDAVMQGDIEGAAKWKVIPSFAAPLPEAGSAAPSGEVERDASPDWRAIAEGHAMQCSEYQQDAYRFRWLVQNPSWTMRWRFNTKKKIEQWQMVDDGEPWGQWGNAGDVLDVAITATKE